MRAIGEELVRYIWQHQLFERRGLTTLQGERLQVFQPGAYQEGEGPDFLDAHIQIEGVEWHGPIEVHVGEEGWKAHKHGENKAYDQVILHVLWEGEGRAKRSDGTLLPALALGSRVPEGLLARYKGLMEAEHPIPCSAQLGRLSSAVQRNTLRLALMQRLKRKQEQIATLFQENGGDTQATAYQWLAYGLGAPLNSAIFLALSQRLPWRVVEAEAGQLFNLEALLLGQGGLLEEGADPYSQALAQGYERLKSRYKLPAALPAGRWQWRGLRPASFPTLRLAQLAMLLHQRPAPFGWLLNTPAPRLQQELAVQQSLYWRQHYKLGVRSARLLPGLGKEAAQRIVLNTVAPLLAACGRLQGEEHYLARALALLQALPAEDNHITRSWRAAGLELKYAAESQAAMELFHHFCRAQACLRCQIGSTLLRKAGK